MTYSVDDTETINDSTPRHLRQKGQSFACSDIGNKDRFVRCYKGNVKYLTDEQRWIEWDGQWRTADKYDLASKVVRDIYNEAAACDHDDGRQELSQWACRSEHIRYLDSMLKLAAEELSASPSQFDTDPTLINCRNGVVEIQTGKLIPHTSDQLNLKQANASYEQGASCPRWIEFLREVFEDNQELIEWIQHALGYSLTGLTDEHVFFLLYGRGRNGKSVLTETMLEILGTYSAAAQFEAFLANDRHNVRVQEAIGKLRGLRFAVASETSDGRRFSESLIKQLTGGDTLIGAKLRGHAYEFKPTHKLWFSCNHLPAIKDATVGMWERVRVVPFGRTFLDGEQDKRLREKLRAERNGIFAWMVAGAVSYFKSGRLAPSPAVCREATIAYRDDNDTLSIFIRERLERDIKSRVGVQEVYRDYEGWCTGRSEVPIPLVHFPKNMEERGITRKKIEKGMVFLGYKLKPTAVGQPSSNKTKPQAHEALPF